MTGLLEHTCRYTNNLGLTKTTNQHGVNIDYERLNITEKSTFPGGMGACYASFYNDTNIHIYAHAAAAYVHNAANST